MTILLDGSVLVALSLPEHVHHPRARQWFGLLSVQFATTPITQGTLIRMVLRSGLQINDALEALDLLITHEQHEFWPDDRPYDARALEGVIGHRQVTDAYLASLARTRGGRLVTLDEGLAVTHADVVDLLPPDEPPS